MEFGGSPNLPTLAMLLPIAAGIIIMLAGTRHAAFAGSVLTFVLQAATLVIGWFAIEGKLGVDSRLSMSTTRSDEWLPDLGIGFTVVMDHAALGLSVMATLVVFAASIFAWIADRNRPGVYHGLLWITLGAVIGLFTARDLIVFYVFFELMLVPAYLLVGGWGGADRIRAATTMFVYTVVGSLPMLVGFIVMGARAGTYSIDEIAVIVSRDPGLFGPWVFFAVVLGAVVKAPLLPVHAWLPLSYRQAPAEVTAVLSGVISKAALFVALVVLMPLFPEQLERWDGLLIAIAVVTLLYGSLAAFRQPDMRGVLAYSSLAQMGLILLGVFVAMGEGRAEGVGGSYLQAINHGVVSAAFFLLAGFIELRAGTGRLADLGGTASGRPRLATVALLIGLVALAVPGSNVFAGELMVLLGAWEFHPAWGAVASVSVVFAALYVLRLVSAFLHRDSDSTRTPDIGGDLTTAEGLALAPLVAVILVLSAAPNIASDAMNTPPIIPADRLGAASVDPSNLLEVQSTP